MPKGDDLNEYFPRLKRSNPKAPKFPIDDEDDDPDNPKESDAIAQIIDPQGKVMALDEPSAPDHPDLDDDNLHIEGDQDLEREPEDRMPNAKRNPIRKRKRSDRVKSTPNAGRKVTDAYDFDKVVE